MDDWSEERSHHRGSQHWVTGLILIALGGLFLLERLGYVEGVYWGHYVPLVIAAMGMARIIDGRSAAHLAKGGFLIFLSFWLYASLEHLWGLTFHTSWPMVLIALGLRYIVAGLGRKSKKHVEESQV